MQLVLTLKTSLRDLGSRMIYLDPGLFYKGRDATQGAHRVTLTMVRGKLTEMRNGHPRQLYGKAERVATFKRDKRESRSISVHGPGADGPHKLCLAEQNQGLTLLLPSRGPKRQRGACLSHFHFWEETL